MKQIGFKFNIQELGWDDFFAGQYRLLEVPGVIPGRVVSLEKDSCQVVTQSGELFAGISGKMRFHTGEAAQYPAVGDWVVIQPLDGGLRGVIHAVLPRKSKFSRQMTGGRPRLEGGRTEEQIVAANVDTVFLVSALDGRRGLSVRRIERYLAVAWTSGASPVILLNKADLCPDTGPFAREVERVAYGIPAHVISARTGAGLDALKQYLTRGSTVALLGSSGVGKSAIINALLGEERQATGEVRESDRRGRHTTTRRQLVLLPEGGVVIDSPGIREIQVWGDENSLDDTFEDIAEIAAVCRFNDCKHDSEPGCAVRAAIARGDLDESRFKNFLKLRREISHLAGRRKGLAALEEKKRWKQFSRLQKHLQKHGKNSI